MPVPVCPSCGTVLLPDARICPFCRMPVRLAPSPNAAPSPPEAPSPPRVCPRCQAEYALPRRVPIVPEADRPIVWEAYTCPKCGRVELYEPSP